jgi:hypothetical protein
MLPFISTVLGLIVGAVVGFFPRFRSGNSTTDGSDATDERKAEPPPDCGWGLHLLG